MPRYSVIVTRDATESVTIEVAARSPGEAETKAREEAENNRDLDWTLDDGNFHDPYTNGAELVDEVEYRTRADLMTRPEWRGMETDTVGNPCVWMNYYRNDDGMEWEDPWSCMCDDDDVSPHDSDWIGPSDAAEIALWESLNEA
jgi:hypothetical protein